jgi:hypothetical protein
MRCFVYYNLHKLCRSVRALSGPQKGRVVLHADALQLENVVFKVSEAGRQRVLRECSRNVHAGMVGELVRWVSHGEAPGQEWQRMQQEALSLPATVIAYNPYRESTFVALPDRTPILESHRVLAFGKRVFALPC